MADFVAVLKKTLGNMGDTSPAMRQRVYDKARATIEAKLAALTPPPPPAIAARQKQSLEDAILEVEAEYAAPPPLAPPPVSSDPLDELDNVFSSINAQRTSPLPPQRPVAPPLSVRSQATPVAPSVSSTPRAPFTPSRAEVPAAPLQAMRSESSPLETRVQPPAPREEPRLSRVAPQQTPSAESAVSQDEPGVGPVPPFMRRESKPFSRAEPEPEFAQRPSAAPAAPRQDRTEEFDTDERFRDEEADRNDVFAERGDRDWPSEELPEEYDERPRRRGAGGLIAALLILLVLGGGGYAAWLYRDDLQNLARMNASAPATDTAEQGAAPAGTGAPVDEEAAENASQPPAADQDSASVAPSDGTPDAGQEESPSEPIQPEVSATEPPTVQPAAPRKFTQRLTDDGSEVDAGVGNGSDGIGEGTSVAAVTAPGTAAPTTPATPPAATPPVDSGPALAQNQPPSADTATPSAATPEVPAGPAQSPGVAVAQRAIFYEERTNVAQSSAEAGSIVWSNVNESPGGDLAPESAIRAEATIPGKDIQLRMTIRRNGDRTLPASHIIEMIFLTPEGFEGGGIENVLRVTLKGSEQETGTPLSGIPAKIADGYFLVALTDSPAETQANLNLLRTRSWIDIPIVYKSGRRALITLEKGLPGEKAFNDALRAWGASAG